MPQLPRAMLIDMDETILSAYGRPEIAWNSVTAEFAGEFAPLSPQRVAAAIVDSARRFWATAEAGWRLKLAERVADRRALTSLAAFVMAGLVPAIHAFLTTSDEDVDARA